MQKIAEEMWCFNCEHVWNTDDYFACKECPACKAATRIYRTSSTAYFYANLEKHPEERERIDKAVADAQAAYNAKKG